MYPKTMLLSARGKVPILMVATLSSCGFDESERLDCNDLLPAEETSYTEVAALVTTPGAKGCSNCHNTASPVYGYNFEGPGVAYDALSTKIDLVYAQVASGAMPKDGVRWSGANLRLLRSWYCHGAIYEE